MTLPDELRFGRRDQGRVLALGTGEARAGLPAEPARIGGLFELPIADCQRRPLFIDGQHRAVAGQDSAADARQAVTADDRLRGREAKGVSLRPLELCRAGEHHGCAEHKQPRPPAQAAARIDQRLGDRGFAGQLQPIGESGLHGAQESGAGAGNTGRAEAVSSNKGTANATVYRPAPADSRRVGAMAASVAESKA